MRPFALLLSLLLLTSSYSHAQIQSETDTLARLTAKALQVKTIQSEFTQEKRLSMFNQTLSARGVFAFEGPDSLRWEYLEPMRSGFVLRHDVGLRWNMDTGEERAFDLRTEPVMQLVSSQILLWTTLDLARLSKNYSITVESESPAVLRLSPRVRGKGPLAAMRIVFSPDDQAISSIEITDQEGDTTSIAFHNTRINQTPPPGTFTTRQ